MDSGSPTAAKITACIKPGEWESAVGDTRQFNDIKERLESAIDAWIVGNPQSNGFVWPPQSIKFNLTDAAAKLSKQTGDSTSQVSIIRAGAAGKIPVHWFNDLHRDTYISDFKDDLRGTRSDGPQRMTPVSLRELALADSVTVIDFAFTDADFDLLKKIKGRAVDDDGFLLGYRHLADHNGGTATITREELFVYGHDLKAYAATLAGVDQVQPFSTPAPGSAAVPATGKAETKEIDPEDSVRRLALLRTIGGSIKYKNGDYRITKIGQLESIEKSSGRKRSDVKTIRKDLIEAFDEELKAKKEGAISASIFNLSKT